MTEICKPVLFPFCFLMPPNLGAGGISSLNYFL
jgi:hypothetical protein